MNKGIRIAIDGPSGSGKSTIAKRLASRLDILYLDTGAMYRAVGLKAIRQQVDMHEFESLSTLMDITDIQIIYRDGAQHIFLDGEDVTSDLRTPEVSQAASLVSASPDVRKKLVLIQQAIAQKQSLVMDGRDIGTHVLPSAEFKFFLTASLEERAKRRFLELVEKGIRTDLCEVKQQMKQRDEQDETRVASPLKQADDAVCLDTTNMNAQQVEELILDYITAHGGVSCFQVS